MHQIAPQSMLRTGLRALTAVVLDGLPLLVLLMLLAGLAYCLAMPDIAYFRVHGVLYLFWLPGWYVARWGFSEYEHLLTRCYLATVISFAIYAILATLGSVCGWNFTGFYCAYGVVFAGCLARMGWDFVQRPLKVVVPRVTWNSGEVIGFGLLLVCAVLVYRWPTSNDIGQFFLQQSEMCLEQSLAPSAVGMTAFDITEPMPRWRAHLFHLFLALLADATQLPLSGVLHQWATIPLGCCLWLALFQFVRLLCGPNPPAWAVLTGIMAPMLLFWRMYNAYDYAFRLTNSPCLDKDFALFYLYPTIMFLSLQALRAGDWKWTGLLVAYAIPVLTFHPMTAVYLVLAYPGLVATRFREVSTGRLIVLGAYIATLLGGMVALGHAQSFHREIDAITRLDSEVQREGDPLHYWYGHYASLPGIDSDTVEWRAGRMQLRSRILLEHCLILSSQLAFPVWCGVLVFRRSRGLPLETNELGCFRLQLVWMLVLAAIWGLSPWLLGAAPYYYRGYERLHWFYFGFFSLIYPLAHLQRCLENCPLPFQRVRGIGLPLILGLLLGDQCLALWQQRPTWVGRLRGINSFCDYLVKYDTARLRREAEQRRSDIGPVGPRPPWLRDDDRVLPLSPLPPHTAVWLQRQSVWWRELYAEAFALAHRGPAFADEVRLYYRVLDGHLTPETLEWLRKRRVTLVVAEQRESYLRELAAALGCEAVELEPSIWRLVPRGSD